jgi:hypothetical protein
MPAADDGPDPRRGPTRDKHAAGQANGLVAYAGEIRPHPGRLWFFALSMAFLGGAVGWIVGNEVGQRVHWTARPGPRAQIGQAQPDATGFGVLLVSREEAERRNTSLAMGILGGVLGLAAGAGGGLVRNTNLAVLQGAIGGLVAGTFAGALVPWMLVPEFYQFLKDAPNPMLPVTMHAIVYAAIGGALGLAFGYGLLGRRGAGRGLLAGVMGAILGSVLFAVLHTLLFPMEWDFSPMPGKTLSRLLSHVCVAMLSVICVTIALHEEACKKVSEDTPVFPDRHDNPAGSVQR